MTPTRSLLSILVAQHGAAKPRGHKWAMKAVNADLSSSHGFTWPFPGGRATSPLRPNPGGACPAHQGDGLCVALTPWGAASGNHRLSTVLLVSYHKAYGGDDDKVRVAHADVHAIFDIPKLARQCALRGADLSRADLSGADLRLADLSRADLRGADLRRANLSGADLRLADLSRADLPDANLRRANLSRADLRLADLSRADLRLADLSRADLQDAYLYGAYLRGAVNLDQAIGYAP